MIEIKARAFAGAFLRWQNEILLIKRGTHKQISPGLWAGVGGRIEEAEMESPVSACIREIKEETGITPTQIDKLQLKYFALCKTENTLDNIYYFSGLLKEKPRLYETSEGKLHWIKLTDGVNLQMATHIKAFYLHYINNLFCENIHYFFSSEIQKRSI